MNYEGSKTVKIGDFVRVRSTHKKFKKHDNDMCVWEVVGASDIKVGDRPVRCFELVLIYGEYFNWITMETMFAGEKIVRRHNVIIPIDRRREMDRDLIANVLKHAKLDDLNLKVEDFRLDMETLMHTCIRDMLKVTKSDDELVDTRSFYRTAYEHRYKLLDSFEQEAKEIGEGLCKVILESINDIRESYTFEF